MQNESLTDSFKESVNQAVEIWASVSDSLNEYYIKNNLKMSSYERKSLLHMQARRQALKPFILDYSVTTNNDGSHFDFDINNILQNETFVESSFMDNKTLGELSNIHSVFWDFIDGFANDIGAKITQAHYDKCLETKNFTGFPDFKISIINKNI
jgi:hypothetical protein